MAYLSKIKHACLPYQAALSVKVQPMLSLYANN